MQGIVITAKIVFLALAAMVLLFYAPMIVRSLLGLMMVIAMVATFISLQRDLRARVLARRVRLFALAVAGLAAVSVVTTRAVIVGKQTKENARIETSRYTAPLVPSGER